MSGKAALGRGLEALIPGSDIGSFSGGSYRILPLDRITANPMQPRRKFGEKGLLDLAEPDP